MVFFKLKYDFSKIKDNQYKLFYKNKIVEIPDEIHSEFIYIIYNEINKEFKNDFKIIEIKNKKIEEEKNEKENKEKENIKEKKENRKRKRRKEEDKIIKKKKLKKIILINFLEAEKLNFYKYKIKNKLLKNLLKKQ